MPNEWTIDGVGTGVTTDTFTVPDTVEEGDIIECPVSNQLTVPALPAAVIITGTPYPGETLTSTAAQQWYCDDVAISGQTAATYVVRLSDIGKVIGQRVVPQNKTIWHPRDLPGVNGVYLANLGLLDASGNPCADGVAVATWQDQSGLGYHAAQATAGLRPLAQLAEVSGNNVVQFDGTDDYLALPSGALGNFQSRTHGYLLVAASDTNRSAGGSTHPVVNHNTSASTGAYRICLETRGGGDLVRARAKTLDADGATSSSTASTDGDFVLGVEADWAAGKVRLRKDGTSPALDGTLTNSGTTSNTAVAVAWIGRGGATYFPGRIAGIITAAPGSAWTATQRSQAERYLGLLIGKNIPLV
ncbi:MAG: hypothetical protein V4726_11205 [Verrucomicrobiota bacterium]